MAVYALGARSAGHAHAAAESWVKLTFESDHPMGADQQRILDAVAEAEGEAAPDRIRHLKKAEMAQVAEELLSNTGWVPEPLPMPGQAFTPVEATAGANHGTPSGNGVGHPRRRHKRSGFVTATNASPSEAAE